MSADLMTVEAVAAALQLHPKTVLRFIREGRLRATKVGREYRILRTDLHSFAGANRAPAPSQARVTSIVDIEHVAPALLQRLTAVLLGASTGQATTRAPISLDLAHDPQRDSLKIIVIAAPADTARLLSLVEATLDPAS